MERAPQDESLAGAAVAAPDDVLVASLEGPADVRTPLGEPGYNLSEFAEIFTPGQAGTLSRIDFQMGENSGTDAPPARITVRVAPGMWPGGVIGEATPARSAVPGIGQQPPPWVAVPFDDDVPLAPGQYYAIVITPLHPASDFTVYGTSGYAQLPTYVSVIDSGNWEQRDRPYFTFRVYVR